MSEYVVSARSVVHRSTCANVRGRAHFPWNPESRFDFDRACLNCLGTLPAARNPDPRRNKPEPTEQETA